MESPKATTNPRRASKTKSNRSLKIASQNLPKGPRRSPEAALRPPKAAQRPPKAINTPLRHHKSIETTARKITPTVAGRTHGRTRPVQRIGAPDYQNPARPTRPAQPAQPQPAQPSPAQPNPAQPSLQSSARNPKPTAHCPRPLAPDSRRPHVDARWQELRQHLAIKTWDNPQHNPGTHCKRNPKLCRI